MRFERSTVPHAEAVQHTRRGAAVGALLGLLGGLVAAAAGAADGAATLLGLLVMTTAAGVAFGVVTANHLALGEAHEEKGRSIGLIASVCLAALALVVVGALLAT